MTTAITADISKQQASKSDCSGIVFFGEVDRNDRGVITSEYPAFMHEASIRELETEINQESAAISRNGVPPDELPYAKQQLAVKKEKLDTIHKSKTTLNGNQKDLLFKHYKSIGKDVGDITFTRSASMKGTASPHEEANRMTEPSIKVDPDLAKACNVRLDSNGRVTRNGASKIWKICGGYLGEPTNVGVLRRE